MPEHPHHNPQEINIRDLIIEDPAPMPIPWEQEMDETFGDGALERATSALKEQVRAGLTNNRTGAGERLRQIRIIDPDRAATLQESLSPKEHTSIGDALKERVRTYLTNDPARAGWRLADLRIMNPTEAATLRESLSPQEYTSIIDALEGQIRTYLTENDPAGAGYRLADLRIIDPDRAATLQESLSSQEHTSIVDAMEELVRTNLTGNAPAGAGARLADLRIIQAHDILWKRDGLHIIDTKPTPQTDTTEPQPELLRT